MSLAEVTNAPVLQNLLHISVKTSDVPTSVRFYCGLLGMIEVDRPAFDFPGAWLATPPPAKGILIHLYGDETPMAPYPTVAEPSITSRSPGSAFKRCARS
jgi:catechol 2,3-dioxygenase-like lactoylglutathione lyase family enzyme